ncbi:hypothetical protein ILUMI_22131 [Ignelater luminosus]|uniref:Uncharacterized protein n=1 Tax=Ignelater luminosus TaxID=2038154 RepID=A0A8K0CGB9_IGNLU|nr:hypothetical protein ILUMI_22131 [Ignelater luminosus]
MGLEINQDKTKFMAETDHEFEGNKGTEITIEGGKKYNFDEVESLKTRDTRTKRKIKRKNHELAQLYGEPYIIGVVKAQRLRWLRDIMRIHSNRTTKKVFGSRVGDIREVGREDGEQKGMEESREPSHGPARPAELTHINNEV